MLSSHHLRPSLLLLLATWMALSLAAFQEMKVWILPEFDNVVFDNLVVDEGKVDTLRECYLRCAADQRCASFFHNKKSAVCRLLRGRYYVREGGRSEQGWRYYLLETNNRCPAKKGFMHLRDLRLCIWMKFPSGNTAEGAITRCRNEGGHLMRVDSQEKQDFLVAQIRSSNATSVDIVTSGISKGYFIDGAYVNSTWVCLSTGQEMTYNSWYPGEATVISVQTQVILALNYGWQWSSVSPFQSRTYVCEIDV